MLYDIKNESMPREELKALQLKRLQDVCRRVYATVPFYRKRFDEAGIKPADVRSLDDLKRLPFTVKQDLRNNYPFGTFAVPGTTSPACMPPAAPPARPSSSATPSTTSTCGPISCAAASWPAA